MKRKSNIKIRHLNVVKNLYKIQNLKNTSEAMALTPAAISKACIEFEKIIGKTLFARTRQGLVPNSIAKRVVEASIVIEKEIDRMIMDIDDLSKDKNHITLAFQSHSITSEMMRCVLDIVEKGDINFSVNYGSREHLFSSLLKGKADIIFASTYTDFLDERLSFEYLYKDNCIIIDRNNIYSINYIMKNWENFKSKIWVLPVRGTAMRDRFDAVMEYNDLKSPKKLIELNSPVGAGTLMTHPDTIGMSTLSYLQSTGHKFEASWGGETHSDLLLNAGIFWRKDARESVIKTVEFFKNNMKFGESIENMDIFLRKKVM
ncbi:hypothetical protein [Acetobacter cibinongensis]|uniref:Transcriptional regulator LysR n=2 Tax=Acetobacter cibinongensis TaxID=146475 RepID=A0A0D6N0I4_9PROT|nr:hypothetical protein [Acetobacter cibinongensis]GAN59517.1 transcriptional regulator LysR [Acetobacter cibinongensis]GBQ12605.1 LysR family transcriptional regulator [Acetobacter cibinongensis NRIC 0482]